MNRVKRLAAVILCAVTAAGIFTGCGDIDRDKYIAKSRSEAEGSSASEERADNVRRSVEIHEIHS